MSMEPRDVIHFETPGDFRVWLDAHHDGRDELWVGYWKKGTGRPSITWEESVDEGLCFGWIDGIRKKLNEQAYTIRFTPRRTGSNWSVRNIARDRELQGAGRIAPEGAAAFLARPQGKSGKYSFEQGIPPSLSDEFVTRLKANVAAWTDWESSPPGYRKQVAHWIMSAKRAETRERRLTILIEDCAKGRKVKPLR